MKIVEKVRYKVIVNNMHSFPSEYWCTDIIHHENRLELFDISNETHIQYLSHIIPFKNIVSIEIKVEETIKENN
jgi:hypothetical protein